MQYEPDDPRLDDISAASAAVLCTLLPQYLAGSPAEIHKRLQEHIQAAILAALESFDDWGMRFAKSSD